MPTHPFEILVGLRAARFGSPLSCRSTACLRLEINIKRKQNILQPDSSPSDRKLPACGGQFKLAASLLTVTDLEVLAAFLLPVLQETIQGGHGGKTISMCLVVRTSQGTITVRVRAAARMISYRQAWSALHRHPPVGVRGVPLIGHYVFSLSGFGCLYLTAFRLEPARARGYHL